MWKALLLPLIPFFIYQVKLLIEEHMEEKRRKRKKQNGD